MTWSRVLLPVAAVALLMGVIGMSGAGTRTAEAGPHDGPTNLTSTALRHGVWLEWTKAGERRKAKYTHLEILGYKQGAKSTTKFTQVEKSNADHAFVPWSKLHLDEQATVYTFRVRGMKGKTVMDRTPDVVYIIPAARSTLPLTPSREHTHPSGFSISQVGDALHFTFTQGVSPRYRQHYVHCREVGTSTWSNYPTHLSPATDVQQVTFTFGVANLFFEPDTRYVCRARAWFTYRGGPMTNAVTFKYQGP